MWEHFIKYNSFKALLCSLAILAQSYLCSPAFTCNFYRWRTFEYDVFWECVMLTKILPSDLWLFPFVTSEGLCLWVLVREDGIRVHFHKDISALYIIGLRLLLRAEFLDVKEEGNTEYIVGRRHSMVEASGCQGAWWCLASEGWRRWLVRCGYRISTELYPDLNDKVGELCISFHQ